MILVGSFATVSAQEPLIPAGCPAVSIQRPAAQTTRPVTAERTASEKLVAEGQAATRTMSGETVAKAISLAARKDPRFRAIQRRAGW